MQEEIIIDGVNVAGCFDFVGSNMCNDYLDGQCEGHNCKYKQLKRLQEILKHTENGRKAKANKLKRIEEIVTHCIQGGFTDEFVQEIFDICREYEEV